MINDITNMQNTGVNVTPNRDIVEQLVYEKSAQNLTV
jgi:hypothetical protein